MTRPATIMSLLVLICSSCVGLCADARDAMAPAASPGPPQVVVFVADGAGGFKVASEKLRETAVADGLPLRVETFDWTHGYWRVLADHIDRDHALREGRDLAARIIALHKSCPRLTISLVGHSAGCLVVLAAAEALPPESVYRIVLLAPAVSAGHDLRPALACARRGIDVFYSKHDILYLGFAVRILGNTDRAWTAAAGRVGFQPELAAPGDEVLFDKLRQYPWAPCLEWTGNEGSHFGAYQPGYLRAAILPLLLPDDNPPTKR